jgi:type IX secretion system PorP/SprF family membrane protein
MHRLCLAGLILLFSATTVAQDIHFSQFYHNPVFQGPGMVGMFDGEYRFAANHRRQWRSVSNKPYHTFALSGDARGFLHDRLNAGASLYHDVAGDSKFRTVQLAVAANWRLSLDADEKHSLLPALQLGLVHRSINYDDLQFGAQYNGIYYDPSLGNQENFQREARFYPDVTLGIAYQYKSDKFTLQTGFSGYNLMAPKQSWFNDDAILLDRRLSSFVQAEVKINNVWHALPAVQLMAQGTYRELLIGSAGRYVITDSRGQFRAVKAGLFYRNQDAGYLMVGMDYDNWTAGISYDINVSNLVPASRYRGGFELALIYIIRKPNIQDRKYRICPDYM